MATLACWIANASGMRSKAIHPDELVGYWVDGEVLTKGEYMQHLKDKIRKRKGVR